MESHELARKLLAMPDQHIFIELGRNQHYCTDIKSVEMCTCEAEIFIKPDYELYDELHQSKEVWKELKRGREIIDG